MAFYRWRLSKYLPQELLAGAGIAVGVALVFAVLVANTSITASAEQLIRGTTGTANFQVSARSNDGIPQGFAEKVGALPGVKVAAPALRMRIMLVGPAGRRAVQLVGVRSDVARLDGALTQNIGGSGLRLPVGIALPSDVAAGIGARKESKITVLVDGAVRRVTVGAVLGERSIGPLSQSLVAVAYLPLAQQLTGRAGRITQVLVDAEPGRADEVEQRLKRLAGDRLTVAPVDSELRLLRVAAEPNNQSTTLFAAIGGVVGILLAVCAMLLTVPERRHFITDLRGQGFDRGQILAILAFEAVVLGVIASAAGIALGDVLSRTVLRDEPGYLALGFPIGTQRVVSPTTIAVALGGGIGAALLASAPAAVDLFGRRSLGSIVHGQEEAGDGISGRMAGWMFVASLGLAGLVALGAVVAPPTTVVGGGLLAIATLLAIPAIFAAVVGPFDRLSRRRSNSVLWFASQELVSTPIRSVALAAVAALAVYGSVAVEGARRDLEGGLVQGLGEYLSTADLWVTAGSDGFQAESFRPRPALAKKIARTRGVESVRTYQGQYLDLGERRIWVIARPGSDRPMIPPSQLLEGSLGEATRQVADAAGWATVSNTLANSRGLGLGDAFELPTPHGRVRLRVAAITTNLGWGPGAVILNAREYRRAWGTTRPVALEVRLASGVSPAAGKRIVGGVLGDQSGLRVQTSGERLTYVHGIMRQGLARLTQISNLLLIAAGLAIAFAMAGAIWQRRPRLASLKVQGLDQWQLWRALLIEATFVLTIGCLTGSVYGVYGHYLAGRWLALTTGFPAPFDAADVRALLALGVVSVIALAVTAVPGFLAARVPPRATFQE